jgi:serine/threonine-protein phosphatase PGAM5
MVQMATKTLVLVRHGQYLPKKENQIEQLTTLGRKQARLAGKRLREYKFDKIYCSTMPRAIETAGIICEQLGTRLQPLQTDNLRECVPGFPKELQEKTGRKDKAMFKEHRQQANRAFKSFFKNSRKDSTELLVCHGNIIRYLICKMLKVELNTWVRMDIQHCGITVSNFTRKDFIKVAR